jgi:hypothetical protein
MEQMIEPGEAMRNETMAEGGSEHAMRPFSASEQFCARSCAHYGDLLVNKWRNF